MADDRQLMKTIRSAVSLYSENQFARAYNVLNNLSLQDVRPFVKIKIIRIKIQCLVQVGNIETAKEQVNSILYEFPDDAMIHNFAARFYARFKDNQRANKSFLRAVCLAPKNAQYAISYARYLQDINSPKLGLRVLIKFFRATKNQHRAQNPQYYLLYLELAHSYFWAQQYRFAAFFYQKCEPMVTEFIYHDKLAECLLQMKQFHKAELAMLSHFSIWGESDPEASFLMAKILSSLKKNEQALEHLNHCLEYWDEIIITVADAEAFSPLIQGGDLKKIPNTIISV